MATVGVGVDKVDYYNSYMFLTRLGSNNLSQVISTYSAGSGINSEKENVIKNIILSEEMGDKCKCDTIGNIQLKLRIYDQGLWSVVCHPYPFLAYLYTKDNQWIYAKPNYCSYLIWI